MRVGVVIALVLLATGKALGNVEAVLGAVVVLALGVSIGIFLFWMGLKAWNAVQR